MTPLNSLEKKGRSFVSSAGSMRLLIGVRGAGLGIGSFKKRVATTAFHYHDSETVPTGREE